MCQGWLGSSGCPKHHAACVTWPLPKLTWALKQMVQAPLIGLLTKKKGGHATSQLGEGLGMGVRTPPHTSLHQCHSTGWNVCLLVSDGQQQARDIESHGAEADFLSWLSQALNSLWTGESTHSTSKRKLTAVFVLTFTEWLLIQQSLTHRAAVQRELVQDLRNVIYTTSKKAGLNRERPGNPLVKVP